MANTTADNVRDKVIEALDEALADPDNFTPESLARIFINFDCKKKSQFFNAIVNITCIGSFERKCLIEHSDNFINKLIGKEEV